jgi:hypothetical protein
VQREIEREIDRQEQPQHKGSTCASGSSLLLSMGSISFGDPVERSV